VDRAAWRYRLTVVPTVEGADDPVDRPEAPAVIPRPGEGWELVSTRLARDGGARMLLFRKPA